MEKENNYFTIIKKRNNKRSKDEIYKTLESDKPKYYILDMFPYPSWSGLHVWHPLGYVASDIVARYKRMNWFNVLHPMWFDSFWLPAEQYAIESGTHPADSTKKNIEYFKNQLQNLWLSFDWSREINTSSPDYYKRTQRIFLKLYQHYYDVDKGQAMAIDHLIEKFRISGNKEVKAIHWDVPLFSELEWLQFNNLTKDKILMNYRLAYKTKSAVNRCEALWTVLANDEIINWLSERWWHPVELKEIEQWSLRITAYIDRLLEWLENLEWSDSLKQMQREWIWKKDWLSINFKINDTSTSLLAFLEDTEDIIWTSFILISPEKYIHMIDWNQLEEESHVMEYIDKSKNKSNLERKAGKNISWIRLKNNIQNPITLDTIPIFVSDSVIWNDISWVKLWVPKKSQQDKIFCEKHNLEKNKSYNNQNNQFIRNLWIIEWNSTEEIRSIIESYIISLWIWSKETTFQLRDANFSRQRYRWEPIPIYYDKEGISHALEESDLPLLLPNIDDFSKRNWIKSPLSSLENWINLNWENQRETDTMPWYAWSSRYFLRYMDPLNQLEFLSKEKAEYRENVDLYVGGTEHAVWHLLYARFWNKFLYDLWYVSSEEPFKKLFNQWMIWWIIEYVYISKEVNKNNKKTVVGWSQITKDNEHEYIKTPITIKAVKNYWNPNSYLDTCSIIELNKRRQEYWDMEFLNDQWWNLLLEWTLKTTSEEGKMWKRYYNAINPNDIISEYGADCLRLYLMFLWPLEKSKPWSTEWILWVSRFLDNLEKLFQQDLSDESPTIEEKEILNKCIKKISINIEKMMLNTCISEFMITLNSLKKIQCNNKEILLRFLTIIAPFAPYYTEELREKFWTEWSIHLQSFPVLYENLSENTSIYYDLLINNKRRMKFPISKNLSENEIKEIITNNTDTKNFIWDKEIKNIIFVKNKLLNIII